MAYIRKLVGKDEKLVGIARLHWIYAAQGLIWLGSCVAFALLLDGAINHLLMKFPVDNETLVLPLLSLSSWLMPFALIFGGIICSFYFIKVLTTEIGLTDRRMIYKTGWIFVRTQEVEIEEIRGEKVNTGYLGRFLNYGYINLDCRFIGDVSLPAVSKPNNFLKALHKLRSEVLDTVSLVVGEKAVAVVNDQDKDNEKQTDLNHDTPELQKDEHLDQTEVIAKVVAEAMRQMPSPTTPVPAGNSVPTPSVAMDPVMVAAIVEQVMPAMVERVAEKVSEKVTEKVNEEMDARGIAQAEIPADGPTPPADPMADPSRLEPEGPNEELLQEFDIAAGVANENDPQLPKPTHAIH